jgi:hypothetical protein
VGDKTNWNLDACPRLHATAAKSEKWSRFPGPILSFSEHHASRQSRTCITLPTLHYYSWSWPVWNEPPSLSGPLLPRWSHNRLECKATCYKVHPNLIPLPLRNLQRLQQTCGPLMLCIISLTTATYSNILCDLPFHTVSLESFLQVLVHLLTARMYGISCFMGYLEDQLPDRLDIENTQPAFEPYHAIRVVGDLFSTSAWVKNKATQKCQI